ncbi:TlpA disulfide reductase family protein [Nonomuraea cavernae]|uniref:TlpA disulfide reductase family protein n=1 Tax=Nonomuraea cavernae TaxID=2045107 RepID=UPI00340FE806
MTYTAVATALVGLLAAANLLLTFGLVRRLREHTTELANLRDASRDGSDSVTLPAGSRVRDFLAESVDGRPVSLDTLGPRPLVGFFSITCAPCKERLPGFVEYAAARTAGPDAVLAVVVGAPEDAADTVELLRPVATVVVETDRGPIQESFGVGGFPAFLLLQDGAITATSFELPSITHHDAPILPSVG